MNYGNGTSNMTQNVTNGTNTTNETKPEVGICTLLIMPWRDGEQDSILIGGPFLNDYYQVYDL
jgi:hypothetical protein